MKRSRIREASLEAVVGAFMFMIILVLAAFTIILSRQNLFRPTVRYEVSFPRVMGLRDGDDVSFRGVVIGKVEKVAVMPADVRVEFTTDRRFEWRDNYRIEILQTSVFGGRMLAVDEGDPDRPLLSEGAPLVGRMPVDLMDEAMAIVASVRETLEGGVLDQTRMIVSNVNAVVARVERGEGSLGKLLKEDHLYDDVRALAANLRAVSDRLEKGEGSLARLLSDDGRIYEDIETVTGNLRRVSDDLASGQGLLGKLLSDDDEIYEDLRLTARSIREISEGLRHGDGTLGKLLREDDIYDEAKLILRELRATIDDFRETAPVTTFTSIFLGAF